MHLALARVRRTGRCRFARVATITAALRLIFKAFFRVELLIANGKREVVAAVLTNQSLVFHQSLPGYRDPNGAGRESGPRIAKYSDGSLA